MEKLVEILETVCNDHVFLARNFKVFYGISEIDAIILFSPYDAYETEEDTNNEDDKNLNRLFQHILQTRLKLFTNLHTPEILIN